MEHWPAIVAEAQDDRSIYFFFGSVVAALVVLVRAPQERRRIFGAGIFFALHVLLLPVVGVLRHYAAGSYRDVRLPCLIFLALAEVSIAASLLFAVLLPRAGFRAPRILRDVVSAGASLVAVFWLASNAGLNLSGLIATSAVVTAVIGFSLQDTLGNIMGGLALQMDASIEVGDWVRVGDVSGKVTEIRWRYTAVETRNWETVIIPNSQLMKAQVTVLGRRTGQPKQWRRWVKFNVDFRHAPSEVLGVVGDAITTASIPNMARDPLPNVILLDFHESYAQYAVRYWLTDIAADDPTDSVVRTRVFFALRRAGIDLSIPAQALFVTQNSTERKTSKSRVDHERRMRAMCQVEIFAGLPDDDHVKLAEGLHYAPFTKGEVLTRQGAEGHWLYMVIGGEVSVTVSVTAADGGPLEREVARLGAGSFFGEMSLMTGEPRTATVIALTDVECYRLDRAVFAQVLRERPEAAEGVADLLARRRVQLLAVRENLDQEAQGHHLEATKHDLLAKIRDFFGLAADGR